MAMSRVKAENQRPQFLRSLTPNPFVKLQIPPKFMKHIQHELHEQATLLSPRGKFWHVDLLRESDCTYFAGGWPEFASAHDLRENYFVLFRYEGNLIFTVKVFDSSYCLKNYSLNSRKRQMYQTISVSSDSTGDSSNKKNKSCDNGNKFGEEIQPEQEERAVNSPIPVSSQENLMSGNGKQVQAENGPSSSNAIPQNEISQNRVDFTQNFSKFDRIVRAYHLNNNYMSIPKKICVKNELVSSRTLFIKNEEGESCRVEFTVKSDGEGRLGKGWRVFSKFYNLKEGDRCLFQFETKDTLLLHVVKSVMNLMSEKEPKKETLTISDDDLIPLTQIERIIVASGLNYNYMTISKKFCIQNGLISRGIVTLKDTNGNSWPVQFSINADKGRLGFGWEDFSKDNELKQGDKCIFEIAAKDTLVVQIVKK